MTALIKTIHVGCRQLGLDNDTRRDLQLNIVGKASLAHLGARARTGGRRMNIDFTLMISAKDVAASATTLAREAARKTLVTAIEATTDAITGTVPLAEKLSWASKEESARAVLAALETGVLINPAIIAGEAVVTGETVLDLSRRIVRNADAYRGAAAAMTGLRRKAEAGLDAAVSLDQIAAVVAGARAGLAQIIAHARGA